MRILIAGVITLAIWCVVSAWLYNDKLLPVIRKPAAVQPVPVVRSQVADSLMKIKASMPEKLMICFDFDKTIVKPDQVTAASIIPFKTWLEKYPGSKLLVTGYTDLVGTVEYNYTLALKRAQIVGSYLEAQGVKASRMMIASKGESEPAADYLTAEGRAKNRRTEISIKME
jgi:outer membrane protein OmpA-like peptidoglycan-associated protein